MEGNQGAFDLPIPDWRQRSSVAVIFPEFEELLRPWRLRFTDGGRSIPPHVTLLYPFYAPPETDVAVLERIRVAVAVSAPWEATFATLESFGEETFFLAPSDPEPFIALTRRLQAAFPELPLYEGEFQKIVPHLTVLKASRAGTPDEAADAVRSLQQLLPLKAFVPEVILMQRTRPDPAPWDVTGRFALSRSLS